MKSAVRSQSGRAASYTAAEIRIERINEVSLQRRTCDTPQHVYNYWQKVIGKMPWYIHDREICVSLALNTKNEIVGHSLVGVGSLNECIVHPRDVFRAAVVMNACSVVLAHNHPSGHPDPSPLDKSLVFRLVKAGGILSINLIDSVIIGDNSYYSFKDNGLI